MKLIFLYTSFNLTFLFFFYVHILAQLLTLHLLVFRSPELDSGKQETLYLISHINKEYSIIYVWPYYRITTFDFR